MLKRLAPWLGGAVLGALAALLGFNLAGHRPQVIQPIAPVLAVDEPQFRRTMGALFGASVEGGHRIDTLINGDRFYPEMLAGIAEAGRSINFENYVYWSGKTAWLFAEAFAERARAGVPVRVLIDWVGSIPMDRAILEHMRSAGVHVVRFRPLHWHTLDRVNNRTHRKLLIIDGRFAFTGGAGIADEWLGDARNPREWRDTHYRVEGPAVAEMQAAFADNWLEATGELLMGDAFFPEPTRPGDIAAQHMMTSARRGDARLHLMTLAAFASARSHIRIGMAYFIPDEALIEQLVAARARGVEVELIVPGPNMDVRIARRASRSHWGRLLESGVRIFEYQPTMYHPKFIVVDEAWTSIGSANLHERSFSLNDEANLFVYDAGFARLHAEIFEADRTRSRKVTLEEWRSRPLMQRTRDWAWGLLSFQM